MRTARRVCFLAGLALLLPALLVVFAFSGPPQYARTYPAALSDKAALLESVPGRRIVIIGGSGAAFGTDSELLETLMPSRKAVNFGLYAGLGTACMLELALPSLHEGDIVVFSPELSGQTMSDWFGAETMWQAAEERPDLLARLDVSRWEALLSAFPRYAAQRAGFLIRHEAPDGDGVYTRASFSAHGDIPAGLRTENRMPGGYDRNTPLRFDPAWPDEAFVKRVNAFTHACEQRGIRVFFRFCPMNEKAFDAGEVERADAFEARLRERLDCPVIGSAKRAIMDAGWFFDTNFHLNGAGARLNTILLAEDLKTAMGDPSPVVAERPEMPDTGSFQTDQGISEDAELFVYDARDGGWAVTGLTDRGLASEKLTVPNLWQGKPVHTLAGGAFAGARNLTGITLQAGLRTILDGAFRGAPNLRSVTLLQENPSDCTVGIGLTEGTDAVILVPAAAYGRYCTNYFWAPHADRLRPDGGSDETAAAVPSPPRKATSLTYLGLGGTLRGGTGDSVTREIAYTHRRVNTLQGTVWFERPGYTLLCWNTSPGGDGIRVGLGSRLDPALGSVLYAQWAPWTPAEDLIWQTDGASAFVTGCMASPSVCVIPEQVEGLPVRGIRAGAFRGQAFSCLVLPPSLRLIEPDAFVDCTITEIVLFDTLETVSDASFRGCSCRTLRVNAATAPVYSGSYFDTFQDKYDLLLSLKGQRKLVLSAGSSGRYGYDSTLLKEAFPEYSPVNMCVYAYTGELPQLRLILPLMEPGDILLYSPEFDAVSEQFCVDDRLDAGFWAMMESCYDTASALDMRTFTGVFDSFSAYQRIRRGMQKRDYGLSPAGFDDDGQAYPFSTYNAYWDFVLPRPNGTTDERLRHNIADYTVRAVPEETAACLDRALAPFTEKGITTLFTYTPRNRASLTEDSTPEARQALHLRLVGSLHVPVISEIEDSLMPGRYFWLIDSHLSTEGARLHTMRVIEDLHAYFLKEEEQDDQT